MKVSVATTAYNHEHFIAQAIESVLMQETDFAFEHVIGEDCSPDRTREIIKDYAQRYPDKVRPLLHENNVGAPENYVQTMAQCRGEYIAFLDGDDFWTAPDKLQRQADFLDEHPECSMCFHPVQKLYEDGRLTPLRPPAKKGNIYTIEDLMKTNIASSLSVMSRAGLFRGFPEWHNAGSGTVGDWLHHAIVATHGDIGYIDEIMGVHRAHSGGEFTAIGEPGRLKSSMRTLQLLDEELGFRYTSKIKGTVSKMYIDLAKLQLSNGQSDEARESLAQCLKLPLSGYLAYRKTYGVLLRLYLPYLVEPLIALKKKFASRD